MFDLLLQGYAWVILVYSDDSKRHVYTTLKPDLIRNNGVRLKENLIYDFNRDEFISFDGVKSVEISLNKCDFDREVDKYASIFI